MSRRIKHISDVSIGDILIRSGKEVTVIGKISGEAKIVVRFKEDLHRNLNRCYTYTTLELEYPEPQRTLEVEEIFEVLVYDPSAREVGLQYLSKYPSKEERLDIMKRFPGANYVRINKITRLKGGQQI